MRLKIRWVVVLVVVVLFNINAYGAKILSKGNLNKSHLKIHKIIKVNIISLRLQKHKSGAFNYVMYIKWKNAGTVNLTGSKLQRKIFMYQDGRKVYLNGNTTPGQKVSAGSIAADAIPLKIVCKNKKPPTLTRLSNSGARDFLVEFVYNSRVIGSKKLLNQNVCKKMTSKFKQGVIGARSKIGSNYSKYKILPDLTVTDIKLDKDCRIWAIIKNRGPGSLPSYNTIAGQAAVRFYVGSKNNGYQLSYLDRHKKLVKPNGTLRATPPGTLGTIPTFQSRRVRVVVDAFANRIKETNEHNNEMTKTLRCSSSMPKVSAGNRSVSYKHIPADTKPPSTIFKILNISTNLSSDRHIEIKVTFNLRPRLFSMVDGLKIYSTKKERYDQTQATHLVKDALLRGSVRRISPKAVQWTSSSTKICNTQEPCTVYIYYDYHIKDIWGRSLDANKNGQPGGSGGNFWYITGSGKP